MWQLTSGKWVGQRCSNMRIDPTLSAIRNTNLEWRTNLNLQEGRVVKKKSGTRKSRPLGDSFMIKYRFKSKEYWQLGVTDRLTNWESSVIIKLCKSQRPELETVGLLSSNDGSRILGLQTQYNSSILVQYWLSNCATLFLWITVRGLEPLS